MPERPPATTPVPTRQGPSRPAWPWLQRLRPHTPLAVLMQAGPATAIGPATTPADWPAWCQAHAGRHVQLWLGASLTHELALAPGLALGDDAALLAYARPLLQHYHGEPAAHWPLAAWRCGAGLRAPQRGVSALHGVDLAALQAAARQAGVRLQAVQPWWSAALALALARVPALAASDQAQLLVVEGPLLTQLQLQRGRLRQAQRRRLPQARWAALQTWWQAQPDQALGPAWAVGHGLPDVPIPGPTSTPATAPAPDAVNANASANSLQPLGRWPLGGPDADWLPAAWPA